MMWGWRLFAHSLESLIEVFDEVEIILFTDGQTDGTVEYYMLRCLLIGELRVRGTLRMDDERLHVSDIGEVGEDLQMIDEIPSCLLTTVDLEGED